MQNLIVLQNLLTLAHLHKKTKPTLTKKFFLSTVEVKSKNCEMKFSNSNFEQVLQALLDF